MKKTALITCITLLIVGCMGSKPTFDCDKILDRNEANLCYLNQSKMTADIAVCSDISDATLKTKCIDDYAIAILDFYPCKNHDRKPLIDACEEKVGQARKLNRQNAAK